MARDEFAVQLQRYGPACCRRGRLSREQSRAYCRRLARSHYENFSVVSWLTPRRLHQHFCNVYAYCRWADDLADETGDRRRAVQLLDWWEQQLADCYRGQAEHPVFVALMETIRQFRIPPEPFRDLLAAFRQDQSVSRYETFDHLLDYCRHSANPVGRLVLHLGRSWDEQNGWLADKICTGLQLANFCQDVACDYDRGRIYLPRESWRRFGYEEAMFRRREYNGAFRDLMAYEVDRAESYLSAGWPLVDRIAPELSAAVRLFIRGGLAIVGAIRRAGYDVWARRPTVGRGTKVRLLAAAWWHRRGGRS